jgi:hypothetical protein
MLFSEVIFCCCENLTSHTKAFCGDNSPSSKINEGSYISYHNPLKSLKRGTSGKLQ